MKRTLFLVMALTLPQAFAIDYNIDLGKTEGSSIVSSTGVVIGSNAKTSGTIQSDDVVYGATYTTLSSAIGRGLTWYSNIGFSSDTNIGDISPTANAVTIVTDGPNISQAVTGAAFAYTLSAQTVADLDIAKGLSVSFDIKVGSGNNNNTAQSVNVQLLTAFGDSNTFSYSNPNKTETPSGTATLTLDSDILTQLSQSGTDQELIFFVSDPSTVTGTNEGWTISNIKLSYSVVPEPATATLSLFALAGLAFRRRR